MNSVSQTVISMARHIREHGNFLVKDDNPKTLTIGYRCTKTNQNWNISLSTFVNTFHAPDNISKIIYTQMRNNKSNDLIEVALFIENKILNLLEFS